MVALGLQLAILGIVAAVASLPAVVNPAGSKQQLAAQPHSSSMLVGCRCLAAVATVQAQGLAAPGQKGADAPLAAALKVAMVVVLAAAAMPMVETSPWTVAAIAAVLEGGLRTPALVVGQQQQAPL
jgi:hypothetical protein